MFIIVNAPFYLKNWPSARGTLVVKHRNSNSSHYEKTISARSSFLGMACSVVARQLPVAGLQTGKEKMKPCTPAKPRVALIMKSLANEFFLTMENGAKAHQQAHADEYELLANGIKDELDVSRQIDLVEQMIAQRVNAIVIAPADSKALVPVCKKAQQAGIVVVNIDNKFDKGVLESSGVKFPFVGPDNRKGAKMVGDFLARKLKPGDQVAIVEGAPNAFNGVQRKLGFEDAMKEAGHENCQFAIGILGN